MSHKGTLVCMRAPTTIYIHPLTAQTDSEWAFALYLSKLPDVHAKHFSPEILRRAMLETIAHLNKLARDANITEVRDVIIRLEFKGVLIVVEAESAEFHGH